MKATQAGLHAEIKLDYQGDKILLDLMRLSGLPGWSSAAGCKVHTSFNAAGDPLTRGRKVLPLGLTF